jgi:hypothetical protein
MKQKCVAFFFSFCSFLNEENNKKKQHKQGQPKEFFVDAARL